MTSSHIGKEVHHLAMVQASPLSAVVQHTIHTTAVGVSAVLSAEEKHTIPGCLLWHHVSEN